MSDKKSQSRSNPLLPIGKHNFYGQGLVVSNTMILISRVAANTSGKNFLRSSGFQL